VRPDDLKQLKKWKHRDIEKIILYKDLFRRKIREGGK
jgi:hypothetical protein